jgi:hypothetical protein
MTRTFGRPLLTMGEAVRANPRAMLEHFAWNAGLIPSGLQVLLFNATSGTVRPGYEPVTGGSGLALALALVLALVYLGGAIVMARDWTFWWSTWLQPRIGGWLLLAYVAAGSLVVMLTQRPRPAYLFGLELGLQAGAGLCVQALLHGARTRRWLATAFPLLVVGLLLVVPGYYAGAPRPPARPLRELYRTLLPYRAAIQTHGTVFVTPGYGFEICAYLRVDPMYMCQSLDYYRLRREMEAGAAWWSLLAARGATMFYADEAVTGDARMQRALAEAPAAGWEVLMRSHTAQGERVLLRRKT